MTKRIFALLLCAATMLGCLTFIGCSSNEDEEDKGQLITTYLTDNIYDLDPANAYNNEAVSKIVGLLFDTLFKLDKNGKVKKSLVDDYVIKENEDKGEYIMQLYLNEDAKWSDGTRVSANDIVFAWQRLLRPENNYEAAALLYDIKNARAAKEGDASIDDVRIFPAEQSMLEIYFEGKIDYDQFLLNLTSLALAPLRDEIVSKGEDWAKKAGTMVCSGPFKLGRVNMTNGHPDDETAQYYDSSYVSEAATVPATTPVTEPSAPVAPEEGATESETTVESATETESETAAAPATGYSPEQSITDFLIERNTYYYRDYEKDKLDKSVTPYKICVDCTLTDEQLTAMYDQGVVMYIGDIPLSLRKEGSIAKAAVVAEKSMSTNSIYLNEKALISNGTDTPVALFANDAVRQALSMVINRDAIAEAVVYAEAATGLIPTALFEAGSRKTTFRDACTATYSTLTTDLTAAQNLLAQADLGDLGAYKFCLTVAAYDDVHCYIAEEIVKAWQALGFTGASVKKLGAIANNDYSKYTDETPKDICDDLYAEELRAGNFEAILFDYVAYSVDPYSMLAPFAKAFSGRGMDMSNLDHYELTPHVTGYDDEDYNKLMETIFAEKTISKRADLYRQAEAMLMEDMPIIPVLFNLDASVKNSDLKKVSVSYDGIANFRKSSVKNYDEYLDAGFKYLTDNFMPTEEAGNTFKSTLLSVDPHAVFESYQTVIVQYAPTLSADTTKEINSDTSMSRDERKAEIERRRGVIVDLYKTHPMWNLKLISARECSYMSWELFRDANTVYGHFFIEEKERIAESESIAESIAAAESAAAAG